jgi:hypothetical protein
MCQKCIAFFRLFFAIGVILPQFCFILWNDVIFMCCLVAGCLPPWSGDHWEGKFARWWAQKSLIVD